MSTCSSKGMCVVHGLRFVTGMDDGIMQLVGGR
jgi:hypothetical protein